MPRLHLRPGRTGRRIIVCDYDALVLSSFLRTADYCVFHAYDGYAVHWLCVQLSDVELLILNAAGMELDVGELIRKVRAQIPGLPVLHIGSTIPPGIPADVPTLPGDFTPEQLLVAVDALIGPTVGAWAASATGRSGAAISDRLGKFMKGA